jgi:hypothetical protein
MLVIKNSTVALGDTLNTFPTIMAIIKCFDEPVSLYWTNKDVGELFPKKYNAPQIFEIPFDARIIEVNYHDYIHGRLPHNGDFTSSVLHHAGYSHLVPHLKTYPDEIDIPPDNSVPIVDFVIAPFVLNNPAKNMTPDFWQSLINKIKEKYDNASIVVIGKSTLPSDADLYKIENSIAHFKEPNYLKNNFTPYLENVTYFWDQPLTKVALLLKNVKYCMISPDSGPSHLMARIGKPHIELFNNWLSHNCILVRNVKNPLRLNLPHEINLEAVLNEIDKVVNSV